MMTYLCKRCETAWYLYMTDQGACPACGDGTSLSHRDPPEDIAERFAVAKGRRERRERERAFDDFCRRRDAAALEAQRREIEGLPEREPERRS